MSHRPARLHPSSISSLKLKVLTVVVSVGVALALAEVGLRVTESLRTHGDALDYKDTWRQEGLGPGGFLEEGFSGRVRDGYGGTVRWVNNSAGFRRVEEVTREREPGTLRILSLGDSFTAGYRVGQEETFSHLLEERLEAAGSWRDVEVLISVVEEPATGLSYLETHGIGWRPDWVLLGLTLGNDVAQTYATLDPREDRESLIADLKTWTLPPECFDPKSAKPPARAGATGGLRLLRLLETLGDRQAPRAVTSLWDEYVRPRLFDNNGLGMYLDPAPPRIQTAYDRLDSVLEGYREVCAAHGIGFAAVLFPQRYQVQPRDWTATVRTYGLDRDCFDLRAPNRRLTAFCRRAGIPCLDPTPAMSRRFEGTGRSLYLPRGDMHWNARGHQALADAIEGDVLRQAAGVGAPM